jgi:anti-sigma regulatory factor (Ser/Thr protein kinase)
VTWGLRRSSGGDWARPLRAHVELTLRPQAAAIARHAVRDRLAGWMVRPDEIEDAELVASELVANALRHGSQPVGMDMLLESGGSLTVAVADASPEQPRAVRARPLAERGRGLPIVAAVAQRWGVERLETGGKRVWARLAVHRRPTADTGPRHGI